MVSYSVQAIVTNTTDRVTYKQKFTSHSSGAQKSMIKAPVWLVSGESLLPGSQTTVSSHGKKDGGALQRPNHLPKTPSPSNIMVGVRVSTYEIERTQIYKL